MDSQDILHYAVAGGFLVLVALFGWLVSQIILTLKEVRQIIYRIEDTTRDIGMVKDGLKVGFYSLIGKLFGKS